MNCELACHLLDDYLENRLGKRDRQRLEIHLELCSSCASEVRDRPAFDQQMWRALTASVQHLRLSPESSAKIAQAAHQSVRRGSRSRYSMPAIQFVATVTAVAILLVGLLAILGRQKVPSVLPIAPQPANSRPALSLTRNDILVEPEDLRPGEPFTTTIFLHSDLSQPVDAVRFRLEIGGPTGDYSFELALQGPFPAQGVSVLQVTPELLTVPCREQYQIAPADIVRVPGVYTWRATLLSPVNMPEQ